MTAASDNAASSKDSLTGSYLVGPDFSVSMPRRDSDPIELGHAASWLRGQLPARAAFVAIDLRSEQSVRQLLGWQGVDQFLAVMGKRINDLRPDDVVFRTGTDTFLVAIADLSSSTARDFAEAFRVAIASPLPLGDSPSVLASRVTVAVACRRSETTAEELYKQAHEVLREANRVDAPYMVGSEEDQ